MTKLNLIPKQRVIFYDTALKSAQYLNLYFDKAKRSESESMAVSKFLKELVTGSPERKAAREASRRNPSIYRLVMFVLGFLVCGHSLYVSGGNWLLVVLIVVCAVATYTEIKKFQQLDKILSD
ncbi:MAG: hypothetical protein EBW46_11705 [Rhodobacterales bacterium]|nr:hypothetical protein [Rhodobacterales bacterium]